MECERRKAGCRALRTLAEHVRCA